MRVLLACMRAYSFSKAWCIHNIEPRYWRVTNEVRDYKAAPCKTKTITGNTDRILQTDFFQLELFIKLTQCKWLRQQENWSVFPPTTIWPCHNVSLHSKLWRFDWIENGPEICINKRRNQQTLLVWYLLHISNWADIYLFKNLFSCKQSYISHWNNLFFCVCVLIKPTCSRVTYFQFCAFSCRYLQHNIIRDVSPDAFRGLYNLTRL